jgi:GNAT superfamily N-acetyltransferase
MASIEIRPIAPADLEFVRRELVHHWQSTTIWSRDVPYQADRLEGFVAWMEGRRVGHLTLAWPEPEGEVVTLSATIEDRGVGTALLRAAMDEAARRGRTRLFLTTSNDNLRALRFYQRRGWRLVAVHRGMIDRYRQREKAIPLVGDAGIPLHDEIELDWTP